MANETVAYCWHDIKDFGVEGKGWSDTELFYDRLPARAKGVVRDAVWDLSRHCPGISARFETDATAIRARWRLRDAELATAKFAASGKSGLDLYAQDDAGTWRWAGCPNEINSQEPEDLLIDQLEPVLRRFMLYLPLYNPVDEVFIGVPEGASVTPIAPRTEKPIVFYGTSILHGACASRPGMTQAAILGRRLDRPVINLGFSGNGLMEPEVADLLAELDPVIYVLDALPNMRAPVVNENAERCILKLREAHPETPLVLVEDRTYSNSWIRRERRAENDQRREAFRAAYARLLDQGVEGLFYIDGEYLFGDDDEASADGSHPSDLGFMRLAAALEPTLREAIAQAKE